MKAHIQTEITQFPTAQQSFVASCSWLFLFPMVVLIGQIVSVAVRFADARLQALPSLSLEVQGTLHRGTEPSAC